jgi:hypothetical protein
MEYYRKGRTSWLKVTIYAKLREQEEYGKFRGNKKICVHRAKTSLAYMLVSNS